MVSLTLTPSGVKPGAGAKVLDGQIAGEAFDAGAVVRKDTNGKWVKARANNLAGVTGDLGIAVSTADAVDQRVSVQVSGPLTCTGLTKDTYYVIAADTAGLIAPEADLASTNITTFVGIATSTTNLMVSILNSRTAHT